MHFRNEFNFWKVHGIMNSSGLLQSEREARTLQETGSIHDSMNLPKLNLLLWLTFYYKYLKYRISFNLGIIPVTVWYLIYNRINGLVRV